MTSMRRWTLATALVLLTLSMTLISCHKANVILLDETQLTPVEGGVPYTPVRDGWYLDNKAFKRLFQELKIEK